MTDQSAFIHLLQSERLRWNAIRLYAAKRNDVELNEAMDAATVSYTARNNEKASAPEAEHSFTVVQTEEDGWDWRVICSCGGLSGLTATADIETLIGAHMAIYVKPDTDYRRPDQQHG